MTIQWFPGHMAKAFREFKEKLTLVDIVYELRDARVPMSSQNPQLDELIEHKARLIILLKKDLADPRVTDQWLNYFTNKGEAIIAVDANDPRDIAEIRKATHALLKEDKQKWEDKGMRGERKVRAVMAGVPNVGKSTLINRMAGKKATRTGNTPGLTQHQQWVKYGQDIELLDMPGVLWPKFEDQRVGYRLALTGAIADRILHLDDIVLYGMKEMDQYYPKALAERYKLTPAEKELDYPDQLLVITKKRGMQDDYERGAEMILHEVRKGVLGRMSFDRLDDDLWGELLNDE